MFDISPLVAYFTPITRVVPYALGTTVKLCSANADRPIIYVYNPGPNDVTLTTPTGVSAGIDYARVPTLSTLKFTWIEDGPMSTFEWWLRPVGGTTGGSVSVVEIIWQPKIGV